MAEKLSVAEQGGGSVVVSVKKGKWLLLEEEEDCVEQLEELGEVIKLEIVSVYSTA